MYFFFFWQPPTPGRLFPILHSFYWLETLKPRFQRELEPTTSSVTASRPSLQVISPDWSHEECRDDSKFESGSNKTDKIPLSVNKRFTPISRCTLQLFRVVAKLSRKRSGEKRKQNRWVSDQIRKLGTKYKTEWFYRSLVKRETKPPWKYLTYV